VSAQFHSFIPAVPLHLCNSTPLCLSLTQRVCLFHQARLLLPCYPPPSLALRTPPNRLISSIQHECRGAGALSDFRESVHTVTPWPDSRKIRGPQISVCFPQFQPYCVACLSISGTPSFAALTLSALFPLVLDPCLAPQCVVSHLDEPCFHCLILQRPSGHAIDPSELTARGSRVSPS
jgi:hypothetical protein